MPSGDPSAGQADTASRPLHIGLLWHTVFNGNLGVGALTLANAELVARAAERAGYRPVVHLLGSRGGFDYGYELNHDHDFTNLGLKALFNPFSDLNRTFRQCDIVFDIGGGDSFSDLYSGKRYWLIILSKLAAVAARAPLVLSPQTIGPFHTAWARLAAMHALRIADRVFARDEPSYALLGELGVGSTSSLSCDVAFALPFNRRTAESGEGDGPLRVGLNVSALLYRRDKSPHTNIRLAVDYPALVERLIDRLVSDPVIELHLVGHVIAKHDPVDPKDGHYEDDYAVARELKARFPGAVLAPKFASPVEAKSYISALDLFAGSRMHATIAAISSEVAVVPLGYSRKFSGLFDSIGYTRNIDLTWEGEEAVLRKFEAGLSDVAGLRDEAIRANAEARRRLQTYVDFLDETMRNLKPRNA